MAQQFISEAITPVTATADTGRMAAGEPGLPSRFTWRGQTVEVAEVLRSWRETGPCRSGSPETYVRKHWYEVLTGSGAVMTLYFERQPRVRSKRTARWWLYSVRTDPP
jgi:phosphoribosylglycinamide formyltransferase-1